MCCRCHALVHARSGAMPTHDKDTVCAACVCHHIRFAAVAPANTSADFCLPVWTQSRPMRQLQPPTPTQAANEAFSYRIYLIICDVVIGVQLLVEKSSHQLKVSKGIIMRNCQQARTQCSIRSGDGWSELAAMLATRSHACTQACAVGRLLQHFPRLLAFPNVQSVTTTARQGELSWRLACCIFNLTCKS